MACGLNEVQTRVDAVINNLGTVDAIFLLQVRIEPRLNVLDNRLPASGKVPHKLSV